MVTVGIPTILIVNCKWRKVEWLSFLMHLFAQTHARYGNSIDENSPYNCKTVF